MKHMDNELNIQLREALATRSAILSRMDSDLDPSLMTTYISLQAKIQQLQAAVEAANSTTVGTNLCTVVVMRGGKNDESIEVPQGTTLEKVAELLNINTEEVQFRKRVGEGQTSQISSPGDHTLGEGTHEFFATHKVAAG